MIIILRLQLNHTKHPREYFDITIVKLTIITRQRIVQIKMIQFASDVGNTIFITLDAIIQFDVCIVMVAIWQATLHVQKKIEKTY